jgi:hypothetical protein
VETIGQPQVDGWDARMGRWAEGPKAPRRLAPHSRSGAFRSFSFAAPAGANCLLSTAPLRRDVRNFLLCRCESCVLQIVYLEEIECHRGRSRLSASIPQSF